MSKENNLNENELQNLYIELNKACTITEYDKALKISNKSKLIVVSINITYLLKFWRNIPKNLKDFIAKLLH